MAVNVLIIQLCHTVSEDLCHQVAADLHIWLESVLRQNGDHVEHTDH